MRKRLTVVGNSLALFIEKPIRRLMQLAPSLEVEVEFDKRRLLVQAVPAEDLASQQPARCPPPEPLPISMIVDAGRVAHDLFYRFQLSPQDIQQLYPGLTRVVRYLGWATTEELVRKASPTERVVVRRMHVAHEQLCAGRTVAEAIAAALRAFPQMPPT